MEKVLVIGLGEVGSALYSIYRSRGVFKVYGYDIDKTKTVNELDSIEKPIDYLHITLPYGREFVDIVKRYVGIFKPKIVFIHSTVAIGTTRLIYKSTNITTAYTPVRGKHPNLTGHMLFWNKWVSALPMDSVHECSSHLLNAGFKVKVCNVPPESLELAKLWETVYRAIMIASWQELHRIAMKFEVDIETVMEFIGEVHEVLKDRPIYFPGYIGGHCLIPNTKILLGQYPSKLFEFILESNEKRLEELKDEKIKSDVDRLKNIVMKYVNAEYYGWKMD
ncbi:MAG: GDP-mannose dehydrogenase [Ignisphaera sp.]|uniref:GDP-mannose dehydrogenase n=1 Tax=Ignisphaera aggregans TaxID=334771 RepID=A0A7C4NSZ6_9CREN